MSDHNVVRACARDEVCVFVSCKLLCGQHMEFHEHDAYFTMPADSDNQPKSPLVRDVIRPSVFRKFARDRYCSAIRGRRADI